MRRSEVYALIVAAGLAVGGCGTQAGDKHAGDQHTTAPRPAPPDAAPPEPTHEELQLEVMREVERFVADLCACADDECVRGLQGRAVLDALHAESRGAPDDALALLERGEQCIARFADPNDAAEEEAVIEAFTNEVCACPDMACYEAASAVLAEKSANRKPVVRQPSPRMLELVKKLAACITRLSTGP